MWSSLLSYKNSINLYFPYLSFFVKLAKNFGADFGFDGISEAQGARRGAVGLVNKPQKIVANDEQYALAA